MKTVQARRPERRGFTLIELVVGLSVSLMVAAGVMDVYAMVRQQMVKGRQSTEMTRNGRAVTAYITSYLRMAGAGLPHYASYNADPNQPPNSGFLLGSGYPLHGPIILGNAHSIGVVGDFVRPDSNFNGISTPAHAEGYQRYAFAATGGCADALLNQLSNGNTPDTEDATNHVTVINELSGGCLAGTGCDTTAASLVLPNYGSSCDATATGILNPTCPWSLNKYHEGEYLIQVFPNSLYINRQIENTGLPTGAPAWGGTGTQRLHTHCTGTGQYQGISMFYEQWGGGPAGDGGRNVPYDQLNLGWTTDGVARGSQVYPVNRGWIATPERVFFRHNTTLKRLEYMMCWGPFAQGDTWWQGGSTALTVEGSTATLSALCGLASGRSGDGSTAEGGTDWQNLADNVTEFNLTYYDSSNNVVSAPGKTYSGLDSITRVGFEVKLQRPAPAGGFINVSLNTSIQLRARRFL